MKPTIKQVTQLSNDISSALHEKKLSHADISKLSDVDPSQVGRICKGQFKTFSHNVVKVCNVLNVKVPQIETEADSMDKEWAKAQSSMLRMWDHTSEGAKTIRRLLDAIADLQATHIIRADQ